jgi:hypothetical protein
VTLPNAVLSEVAIAPPAPAKELGDKRFTLDGSPELERHLARIVEKVRKGVMGIVGADRLEGLLLAGGYGRGEGGVLRTPEGDSPYNDLEFYVFIRGPLLLSQRRFQDLLHKFAEELTPEAGIEIELKVYSLAKLRASGVSMFFYDLVAGHRWTHGDAALLAGCGHHFFPERIPLHEAARLLMNRCSGLLFAVEYLQRPTFTPEEADFVERNLNKLRLALGDAVLTAFGRYHWSCRERHIRLMALNSGLSRESDVLAQHALGVQFKLHPFKSRASRETLQEQHRHLSELAQVVWLWLENRRLKGAFKSPEGYVAAPTPKWPESPGWRNLLLNVRCLGRCALHPRRVLRHPRERVLNALVLLLWMPLTASNLRSVQQELCLSIQPTTFSEIVSHYRVIWSQVN